MTQSNTLLDALLASLHKAADYNRDDAVPPAAILWTDEKREWERLAPRLRSALPHFFVLGPYDGANRTGPAIWLRCVLAGKAPPFVPAGAVPILYLPGVSRSAFRDPESCPPELKPIFELQFRGQLWSHDNGKDWTVSSFLQAEKGGLQLMLAKDQATATSIRRAVEKLADVPVADLLAKSAAGELNAGYFDSLIIEDLVDDLLSWLSDPKAARARWGAGRWEALCSRCVADYEFDPVRDGELVGAEKLGTQPKAVWKTAWRRFAAAPFRYPGLEGLLRKARPSQKRQSLFSQAEEAWPQDNEAEETALRQALLDVPSEQVAAARSTLLELEGRHRPRREWVWAKLNRSPLARAVEHLAALAAVTAAPLTGSTTADMPKAYTEGGWKADAAVLDALAAVALPADQEAVSAAVAHVYAPWLRDAAELFQRLVKREPLPGSEAPRLGDVPPGTCVVFADGLRYDVGQKLLALLAGRVGPVQLVHQFVALPSVTPTAKPAVSPVASKIKGTAAGEEFRPCLASDGKDLTPERFRRLLADDEVQFLGANEPGDPTGKGWTEFGNVDKTGHDEGAGLARRIPELLAGLVRRIESLLARGWQEVRVVTDHGWLLMPNGLPKCELPKYLTATRWRRCAVVKPNATVELPCFSWFWAEDVRIACPEGIGCFMLGEEYHHGGLSLQECVVPQLSIRPGKQPMVAATIEQVKWAGLRCRVKLAGQFDGCKVSLRDKAADASTSLAGTRPVAKDGSVALIVEDDQREGTAAILVLLDGAGNVVEKMPVTVGG